MRVLIACEESQAVCKEFRKRGHEAYSCDIQDCSGGHPEWHIKGDVRAVIFQSSFDLKICFPPRTDLAVSGSRWFDKKRLSGEQQESIMFFLAMYNQSEAIENPIGIMNGGNYLKKWFPFEYKLAKDLGVFDNKPQIIHPWQFGHGEQKATCLWLKGLPKLVPTDIVEGREQRIWRLPPTADRTKLRSKTFSGIAKAMAEQWG
jgi:hypothetical protein